MNRIFERKSLIRPEKWPFFYGWLVVGMGTVGILMSAPGQTVGVSVFTDHLIRDLAVSRSNLSLAYLFGTVASALLLPFAGRLFDRYGAKIVSTLASALMGLVLILLSFADKIAGPSGPLGRTAGFPLLPFLFMIICFFLLRFSGQGVLTLSSRNMAMKWFEKRRGMVNAVIGVSIALGFSLAPQIFNSIIQAYSWQWAWRIIGFSALGFSVVAFIFFVDNPEEHGLNPDGKKVIKANTRHHAETGETENFTLKEARRTYSFWVFTLILTMSSLVLTAYTFHIVSIFQNAGMSRTQAVAVFFPASIVAVAVQFTLSWLSDYVRLKWLLIFKGAGMILMMTALFFLHEGFMVVLLIIGHGITQGMMGILSALTWPRFFGRKHLGSISGLSVSVAVAGSAVGPYFFSLFNDLAGTYSWAVLISLILTALITLGGFKAEKPAAAVSENRDEL
ncbi:MAG: MFS transporter [Spirochaetia bacterium]